MTALVAPWISPLALGLWGTWRDIAVVDGFGWIEMAMIARKRLKGWQVRFKRKGQPEWLAFWRIMSGVQAGLFLEMAFVGVASPHLVSSHISLPRACCVPKHFGRR